MPNKNKKNVHKTVTILSVFLVIIFISSCIVERGLEVVNHFKSEDRIRTTDMSQEYYLRGNERSNNSEINVEPQNHIEPEENTTITNEDLENVTHSKDSRTRAIANWTFMTYMAGDSDLWEEAYDDINEMEDVGSTEDLNIIVLFDADGGHGTKPNDSNLYRVTYDKYLPVAPDWYDRTAPKSPIVDTSGEVVPLSPNNEVDMSDPETLIKFINFTVRNYPAKHYFLDLWDHGDGLQTCRDYGLYLTISELNYALNESLKLVGLDKFDVIAFDSCLMGRVEIAYQMIDYADIVIFSEKNNPSDGMPYDEILAALKENTNISKEELSKIVVKEFQESYVNICDKSVTFSAINTSHLPQLIGCIDKLAVHLITLLPHFKNEISYAYNTVESYEGKRFGDLYHFAELLANSASSTKTRALARDVMDAVNRSVISEKHWTNIYANDPAEHAHGMTIFLPSWVYAMNGEYLNMRFCADTNWNEFINEYFTSTHECKLNTSVITNDTDNNEHVESAEINYSINGNGEYRIYYEVFKDGNFIYSGNEQVNKMTNVGKIVYSAVDFGNYTFALFLEEYDYSKEEYRIVDCALIERLQLENGNRDLQAMGIMIKRGDGAIIKGIEGTNNDSTNKSAVEGDEISICAVVYNSGAIDSFEIEVSFFVDNEYVGVAHVDITKGEIGYPAIKWKSSKGEHTVQIIIDPANVTEEYNESNNRALITFLVKENRPDCSYRIHGFVFDNMLEPILYASVNATNVRNGVVKKVETGNFGLGYELYFEANNEYIDGDRILLSVEYFGVKAEKSLLIYSEDKHDVKTFVFT
ncbi:MAG: clostripain-related cysteine peptidase [Thermoplasmata archaeon]